MVLPPEKLQKASKRVEEENWILRGFLKDQDPDEVDSIVHNLHKELFEGYDCIACSNCCKTITPIVKGKEIKVISAQFKLTATEFKKQYLIKTDEGFIINKKPCPFLTESGCLVYEHRPVNCREYPFTDKEEILTRLINLLQHPCQQKLCLVRLPIIMKKISEWINEGGIEGYRRKIENADFERQKQIIKQKKVSLERKEMRRIQGIM